MAETEEVEVSSSHLLEDRSLPRLSALSLESGDGNGDRLVDFFQNFFMDTTHQSVAQPGWVEGGGFKVVMIQSNHRFGPGWAPVLRLRCAQPLTVRALYASPQRSPAKLDSEKFGSSRRDQTV